MQKGMYCFYHERSLAHLLPFWISSIYLSKCNISLINVGGKMRKMNGILLPKLFWPALRKKCSEDREKLLRSLEQFFQTVKGQNNLLFKLFPECFSHQKN